MSSTATIEGSEHVPDKPILVIPNRVDMTVLHCLEHLLGGSERKVAWLVERSLYPDADIMAYLQQRQARGILCAAGQTSRESLIHQIRSHISEGRHVVLLPGRPLQVPAGLADVPLPMLDFLLADYTYPVLPIYVGMYHAKPTPVVTSQAPYERAFVRVLPVLTPPTVLAPGVMQAWMGASAAQVGKVMEATTQTLATTLLRKLLAYPNAKIIDGVDETELSYRQLLLLAAPLARSIRKQTISKRLGIILPPGKLSIIANVACILAGITPVNIDYSFSKKAFDAISKQAELTRFITEHRFIQMQVQFPWPPHRDILFVDDALAASGFRLPGRWNILGRWMTPSRILSWIKSASTNPQDEALAVFTSADESSEVKGASLSHIAVLSGAAMCYSRFRMGEGHKVLSVLPFHHRAGLLAGLIYPLLLGQDIIPYPIPDASKRLCRLARQYSPALAIFTPEQAAGVLAHAQEGDFASTSHFHVAGTVPIPLAQEALQKHHIYLCECYLPLESAMPLFCSSAPPQAEEGVTPALRLACGAPGTVGTPLPGVAIRITHLDHPDTLLPISSLGLIWVKSSALFSGYPGKEASYTQHAHERWLCTGDVGYMRQDGLVVVEGPRHRFAKLEGELISLTKIEQLLMQYLRIKEVPGKPAFTIIRLPNDEERNDQIILLSTVQEARPNDATTLSYALKNVSHSRFISLSRIISLRSIPTLPNGKVDYATCYLLTYHVLGITPPPSS